jgi:hypothetical protein
VYCGEDTVISAGEGVTWTQGPVVRGTGWEDRGGGPAGTQGVSWRGADP